MGFSVGSCPNSQIGCVAKAVQWLHCTAFFYSFSRTPGPLIDKPGKTGQHACMYATTVTALIRRMFVLPVWHRKRRPFVAPDS
jgi:hypothetical protein